MNKFFDVLFKIFIIVMMVCVMFGLYKNFAKEKIQREELIKAYMNEFKLSYDEAERKMLIDTNNPTKVIVIDNSKNVIPDKLQVNVK